MRHKAYKSNGNSVIDTTDDVSTRYNDQTREIFNSECYPIDNLNDIVSESNQYIKLRTK